MGTMKHLIMKRKRPQTKTFEKGRHEKSKWRKKYKSKREKKWRNKQKREGEKECDR